MTIELEKTKILIKLNPAGDPTYLPLKAEIERLCQSITGMTVNSQRTIDLITQDVNLGAKIRSEVEALRKRWKAPALDAGRIIDKAFNELLNPLDNAKAIAERKVTQCRQQLRAEQARIEAENRRLEAERQAAILEAIDIDTGEITRVIPPAVVLPTIPIAEKTVTVMGSQKAEMAPKYRLVDIALVPTSLLMLDEQKIKAQLKAGVREISGLEIWVEEETRFRTGRR